MKRFTLFLISLILSVVFSTSASADVVKIDGIYYYLISEDKTAVVTENLEEKYSGEVVIPSSITSEGQEYKVTIIGGGAFEGCNGLTSISIPNSVTSIDGYAFKNCSGLTSITIPNSVTVIDNDAFSGCISLTSITIPNSVTSIDDYAFYNCSGLTSITIPNSVTNIGEYAFSGCNGLTSITIPNSVTSFGSNAFAHCGGLTSATIGNSVTSIGDGAFQFCSSLTSVDIPNSVTSIGEKAFAECSKLENVYCYAENVPSTDATAFEESNIASATLYVPGSALSSYQTTAPWSGFGTIKALNDTPANINTAKTRGVVIQSARGFITLSGLDTNERVDFFTVDGVALGSATATDGTATFSATSGTIVIAKIGKESVKIAVE